MKFSQQTSMATSTQPPLIHEVLKAGIFGSPSAILERQGYTLGKVVGEGSYCKVRIAEQRSNGVLIRRMAVKIINRQRASKDFVARFLPREIEILTQISHPNIVTVHRILDIANSVYIFMDLADQGDLLEFIRSNGALPELRAKKFFAQLLSAVRYLHAKEITHRDLKCENVLIFNEEVIRLTDFGFSRKCLDVESGRRVLSRTYCGSAAYAAPEILSGTPYNPKMYDVWSMGCILFIMLTANMPFDDSNVPKMLRYQQERRVRFPSKLEDVLTQESKQLVRHMLEPDVCRRAMVEQIVKHRWLNDEPPAAPTHPSIRRTS